MSRHNIQFKGIRHSPSDITGQDGDLLECVNLVHEGGELKPIEMPERMQMKGLWNNETLVAVHNLTDGKKYVFVVWNTVSSHIHIRKEDGTTFAQIDGHDGYAILQEEIKWVEAIGNTLIFGTDKSIHYAKYKNGQYKWLGDKLPQPVFEFDMGTNDDQECYEVELREPIPYTTYTDGNTGPQGGICVFNTYAQTSGSGDRYTELFPDTINTDENKRLIRDNLRSKMATLMHNSRNAGRFVYPFMARYAIRLYDDNYVMHSAPVLLLPSNGVCPILAYLSMKGLVTGDHYSFSDLVLTCNTKPMTLKFVGFKGENGEDMSSTIGDWEDIIKGVDIFLSSQVVSFDDSYYDNVDNVPTKYYTIGGDTANYGSAYAQNIKETWLTNHQDNGFDIEEEYNIFYKNQYFPLRSRSIDYVQERISETSLFYQVKKYDLSKLNTDNWSSARYLHDEIESGLIERLETLPTLPDDYVSKSRITGEVSYNYNQRLVMGDLKLQEPLWYQDAKLWKNYIPYVTIDFVIEKPEKTIVIEYAVTSGSDRLGEHDFGHYLFYPDPDCKKAYVTLYNGGARYFKVPMNEHTGLHGAYALMPNLKSLWESYDDFTQVDVSAIPAPSTDRYYQMANTIAMSGVANPFYFPASNFKDIGRTKVIGIAANVLDVNYEQWGPFPLYAFCSDGIVAITIDKEGKFGGEVDAVSADVLREPTGLSRPTLIQANQALVFLTQRGVMMLTHGSKPTLVSEAMEGRHFNAVSELSEVEYNVWAFADLIGKTSDDLSFKGFAESGFLAYDYAHNRVLLLRPDKDYQYVYTIGTGLWSKQIAYTNLSSLQMNEIPSNEPNSRDAIPIRSIEVNPMRAVVNNYTEMYLQDADGWVYKTMEVQGENSVKQLYQYGYFVSRPVRFGTDAYKSIARLLHRYTHYASNSFVKCALYGSRDGVRYGRINTLRGMSWQYYIFVVYTYLKPNERYSYMSVEFEPRLTNKLR